MRQTWEALLASPAAQAVDADVRAAVLDGVPSSLRGAVWRWLAARHELGTLDARPYLDLLLQPCIYRHAIKIDVDRTFPEHPLFQRRWGPGQQSLFNCMQAYSVVDAEVGYCQGLSFVGGLLLMNLNEQEAFRVLLRFMYTMLMRRQYMPDMVPLQIQLYQFSRLLHDHCPAVFAHFEQHAIEPFLYATPWFLSVFSSQFPVAFCERVMDWILVDGLMVVFRVALTVVVRLQRGIVQCDGFEATLKYLQQAGALLALSDINAFLREASNLPLSHRQLELYAHEFEDMRAQTIDVPRESSLHELRAALLEEKMERKRVAGQLDIALQQINHAKSALQSLRADHVASEAACEELRRENAELRRLLARLGSRLDERDEEQESES